MAIKLFQLTNYQRMQGQQIQNVYNFVDTLGTGSAKDLAEWWTQNILPPIASSQAEGLEHLSVVVEELTLGIDTHTVLVTGTPGGRGGQWQSAFDCFALAFPVPGKLTRAGRKAIAGIPESDVEDGVPTAAVQSVWDAIARVLAVVIVTGLAEYIPVIMREELTEFIAQVIIDGVFRRLSTQNSRKTYTGGGADFQQLLRGTHSVQGALSLPNPNDIKYEDIGDLFFDSSAYPGPTQWAIAK